MGYPSRKRSRFYLARRRSKASKLARLKSTSEYKAWLKDNGWLRCEVCGWSDPLLPPYFGIEIHHIRRHADGGHNHGINYLACCPNHHAIADRLSTRDRNMTKDVIIALILEHEHNSNQRRA